MLLKIRQGGSEQAVEIRGGENLLKVLSSLGYEINAVCAGNGSCHKCKVKILYPAAEPAERERSALTAQEIKNGIRLACAVTLREDTGVEIIPLGGMEVLQGETTRGEAPQGKIRAVFDIGTTTLVAALADGEGHIIASAGEKNRQASFGADVITRVKHVANGGLRELHAAVTEQANGMLKQLLAENRIDAVEDITLSGNTAMLHLFLGRDCSGLGFAPYTAQFLATQTVNGKELGLDFDVSVRTLPCVASFAGGDLTAGIVSEYTDSDRYTLLIDLGTNAEIALYNRSRILASSAAAGPAFEGASIKQGMGAVPGAVCSYEYSNGSAKVKTIGGAPPAGICGSGLIDIAAELLSHDIIDETGYLLSGDKIEVCEGVSLFAQDVRELQLAKAAIAAAIDMLLLKAGLTADDVERVLVGGGFGNYINPANAARIGLFPKELQTKTAAAGNTSLAGGVLCAVFLEKMALAEHIAASAQYIDLTNSAEFSDRYIEHMMF